MAGLAAITGAYVAGLIINRRNRHQAVLDGSRTVAYGLFVPLFLVKTGMDARVNELGAAFLCADLDLTPEPRPDHAAYIASWLKALKNDDRRAIFTAASYAQRAADFLSPAQPAVMEEAA